MKGLIKKFLYIKPKRSYTQTPFIRSLLPPYALKMMMPWTPVDRNAFIKRAVDEKVELRGSKGAYWFNVMPKNANHMEIEDIKRSKVTEALAKTIYEGAGGKFKGISTKIYDYIRDKLRDHPALSAFDLANISVIVKGSNAYALLLQPMISKDPSIKASFPFSDLDIVILINPHIPEVEFERIRGVAHTVVVQAISQFKRLLDHMLFLDKPFPGSFLTPDEIKEFKTIFAKNLNDADERFLSPFSSEAVRNACSRNSFIIAESQGHTDSVVRVEVPHYDKCECIPLRKTPLFCSYNETLEFNRAIEKDILSLKAKFNLYRMKINVMYLADSEESEDLREEKVTADFIDISIANRDDSELLDFWAHGRCIAVADFSIHNWICIPDIHTCISDLTKMLYVYECPEYKKEKRQNKLNIMKNIAGIF